MDYAHTPAAVESALQEHWSIHEVGGAQFIRVDIDGRAVDGHSTLIEALRTPAGHFERIDQQLYERANARPGKLSHTFFEDRVELVGLVDDHRSEAVLTMPPGYGLFSESWLLTGFTIQQAAQKAGRITVLRTGLQGETINYSQMTLTAVALGQETITVTGHELVADCYRWQDTAAICLDQHGVLLRADTPTAQIRLSQYARRPEPNPS